MSEMAFGDHLDADVAGSCRRCVAAHRRCRASPAPAGWMSRSAISSLSASTAVVARMPVRSWMRSTRRRSLSKPSQPAAVPLQPMTSTLASASRSAAARILLSSNWPSPCVDKEISVTLKREKCALQPGTAAASALVNGSSAVLDDGVNTPSRIGRVMVVFSGMVHMSVQKRCQQSMLRALCSKAGIMSASVLTLVSAELDSTIMLTINSTNIHQ